jgi:hypothetical protein
MRSAPPLFYKFLLIVVLVIIFETAMTAYTREKFMVSNRTLTKGITMPENQPTLEDFGNGIFIIWL